MSGDAMSGGTMSGDARCAVLFPGAGSFGAEFQPLLRLLRPAGRLARYPGRFGPDFGTAAASFDAVVQACAEQITRRPAPGLVLLGHSYGAYLAYATAAALQAGGTEVSALVVVAAAGPRLLRVSDLAVGTPDEVASYLAGVDPGMLADAPSEEWREVVVETTRQDLRLLRQLQQAPVATVHCPLIAVRGDRDPLCSDADLADWAHATECGFSTRTFPGGHSDLLRTPEWSSWVCELLGL